MAGRLSSCLRQEAVNSRGGSGIGASKLLNSPLGPFGGSKITVYSAKGKNARLHVRRECGQLRTTNVTRAEVPLSADVVDRFCSGCSDWGPKVRPTTGLGIFLAALGGAGLLHQLQAYAGPDEDVYWTQDEVHAAAELLRSERDPAYEDDDERWEARKEAEELQDRVLSRWRHAAGSLHRAQAVIAHFPWLRDWARPRLSAKEGYLESLWAQAALFVEPAGLVVAAAAAELRTPSLPADDPVFAVLGDSSRISLGLSRLWRRWQYTAENGWEGPASRAFRRYDLVEGIRSNKKGRAEALEGAGRLIQSWEGEARAVAAATDPTPTAWVTARLPEDTEEPSRGDTRDALGGLDRWTLGVVVTWTVTADWSRRTLTLKVPTLVAERLLASSSVLSCERGADAVPAEAVSEAHPGFLRPGVFDDTPVFDRQPVTLAHLRALRDHSSYAADQLYIVFSTSGGAEVLALQAIEKRVEQGWLGVIFAGASDLSDSLISPWIKEVAPASEADEGLHLGHDSAGQDDSFGVDLGLAGGTQAAVRWAYGERAKEQTLRLLAMARGVSDLRSLDTGRRSGVLSVAVWEGLLTRGPLDLTPFRAPGTDRWRRGSGLPLGVLGPVQIYATNSDPAFEGKGHSPLCRHTRDRGLAQSDDLLRVSDLLARDDWDWCSNCGGYSARRLTDTQLSYYRAAHQLLDIAGQLDDDRAYRAPVVPEALCKQLEELADWEPGGHENVSWDGRWRWREVVSGLRSRAERKRLHTAP
ncbi:hypothetical protein [Streptomyces venezuelae]|uniref:hypothetical protein n=1 Tax=Streptomyces venezuelae TaxID=54571 RepID=UPI00362630F1